MFPIIPFIIPMIHFGFDWLISIFQWPSIDAML